MSDDVVRFVLSQQNVDPEFLGRLEEIDDGAVLAECGNAIPKLQKLLGIEELKFGLVQRRLSKFDARPHLAERLFLIDIHDECLCPVGMLAVGKLLQQRPELAVACPDVIERELGLHEPGANGIKVHDGRVYVSTRDGIQRARIETGGGAGPLTMFSAGTRADDFGIGKDGTLYIPVATSMLKVSPAGEVSTFLDGVPNGAGAIVSNDARWLYWATRRGDQPQRLLRVAIP